MKKKVWWIIILVMSLILIDQIIKGIVIQNKEEISKNFNDSIISFTYCENRGGAFGIGNGNVVTFIIVNVIVLGLIVKFMINQYDTLNNLTKVSLSLFLAGGISNLFDRIFRGYVVDFIDVNKIIKYPIFNIADIILVIGSILLIIEIIISNKMEIKEKEGSKVE